jgi:hypothetical protein
LDRLFILGDREASTVEEPAGSREADPIERVMSPWIHHHPRSADASLERLREVIGIVKFNGSIPSWRDFAEEEAALDSERGDRDAGH